MLLFQEVLSLIGVISLIVLFLQKKAFFSTFNSIQKICFILLSISVSVPALIAFFSGFAKGFWENL